MASDNSTRKFQKELNSGVISLVLLSLLERHGEAMYGYEIGRWLESHSGDRLPMNQGAIYPVLRSLEKQGLLGSQMLPSETGPPRKYYQITANGRRSLADWTVAWEESKRFVESVLETSNAEDANTGSGALPGRTRSKSQGEKRSHSRGRTR
ncbi:PadR family transcriptional regulator [Blastopirellula marina]|uniref:PadR family transcriptional regulator n=1 Tax=Blastopirellula marina TaxID=124 RepID=A0A2S8G9S7_9BACT|nr:PadR family transcriptional regulator [Blastopirellula marina]PQO41060.1 PadR family transcriptional regulator [Blastopirellula marina]PTL45936.1 PadR family transcriptional regulator [Blastopirellula marina]